MGFSILGRLATIHDDRDITPTAPKVRQVLALLLVSRNQIVPFEDLVDELWGDKPPASAMTTLQTYVYKLRKEVFDPSGLARLHTQSSGYLLEVADDKVDVHRFEVLARQGRLAHRSGDSLRASELLTEALSLWRGRPLLGVNAGEILSAHVTRLEETKLQVLTMRIDADLALGRHDDLVSELKVLVRSHPLHEHFHTNLMTVLDRSGRRYEALQVYRRLRTLLISELGLEPSPQVQRLHQSLLDVEPAGVTRVGTVPAQLPPDIAEFTGRADTQGLIRSLLEPGRQPRTTVPAVLVGGLVGAGKTTLAVRVAHQIKERHPDGQLFADLRGSCPQPAQALTVLTGFLKALGVPEQQIPGRVEDCAALFRTWTDSRRLLVVLDDAASASQLAPLIPAGPGNAVIITSRWGLQGLPGVCGLTLDMLPVDEAIELLARLAGRRRVAADRAAAERIVECCGYLPMAVRCVGARLAAAPAWPLKKMATLLDSGPSPLDQLRFAELDVRAEFEKSYRRLDPVDGSVLRLISLLPVGPFTGSTAAGLLGAGVDAVEERLSRLVANHLLEARTEDDSGVIRYELNRLTRRYAWEQLNREFIEPAAPRPRTAQLPGRGEITLGPARGRKTSDERLAPGA